MKLKCETITSFTEQLSIWRKTYCKTSVLYFVVLIQLLVNFFNMHIFIGSRMYYNGCKDFVESLMDSSEEQCSKGKNMTKEHTACLILKLTVQLMQKKLEGESDTLTEESQSLFTLSNQSIEEGHVHIQVKMLGLSLCLPLKKKTWIHPRFSYREIYQSKWQIMDKFYYDCFHQVAVSITQRKHHLVLVSCTTCCKE